MRKKTSGGHRDASHWVLSISSMMGYSLFGHPFSIFDYPHCECFFLLVRISFIAICCSCQFSYHSAPLREIWLYFLCTLTLSSCRFPFRFLSKVDTVLQMSSHKCWIKETHYFPGPTCQLLLREASLFSWLEGCNIDLFSCSPGPQVHFAELPSSRQRTQHVRLSGVIPSEICNFPFAFVELEISLYL